MGKSIYHVNALNGKMFRWDGISWAEVGNAPSTWPTTSYRYAQATSGCFVYRGKLFVRHRKDVSAGNTFHGVAVREWDPTAETSSEVATLDLASYAAWTDNSSRPQWNWSNAVNYRGRIYWVMMSNRTKPMLCSFYYNGSSYVVTCRVIDEISADSMANVDGNLTSTDVNSGPPISVKLEAVGDRLIMGPSGFYGNNGSSVFPIFDRHSLLDISSDGSVVTEDIVLNRDPDFRFVTRSAYTPYTLATANNLLNLDYIAYTTWNGKVYYLTQCGRVMVFDPEDDTTTLAVDLLATEPPEMAMDSGATYTTNATPGGGDAYRLRNSSTHYDTRMVGSRVKILNYYDAGSYTGTTKQVVVLQSDSFNYVVCDLTGADITRQPSGGTYKVWWGFGCEPSDSFPTANQMFIWNDKLHVLSMPTRHSSQPLETPPWTLHVWDGVTDPDVYSFTLTGGGLHRGWNPRLVLDVDEEVLHIITTETLGVTDGNVTDTVLHLDTYTFDQPVTIYASDYGNAGSLIDVAVAFDEGDVTANITGVVLAPSGLKTTVSYSLFGTNVDDADILVEYDTGDGWTTATRLTGEGDGIVALTSAAAGAAYTFVHDLVTDSLPGAKVSIQYRITITAQTRL